MKEELVMKTNDIPKKVHLDATEFNDEENKMNELKNLVLNENVEKVEENPILKTNDIAKKIPQRLNELFEGSKYISIEIFLSITTLMLIENI